LAAAIEIELSKRNKPSSKEASKHCSLKGKKIVNKTFNSSCELSLLHCVAFPVLSVAADVILLRGSISKSYGKA